MVFWRHVIIVIFCFIFHYRHKHKKHKRKHEEVDTDSPEPDKVDVEKHGNVETNRTGTDSSIIQGLWCKLNATFNNISVILWRLVLLMEKTRVPGENHGPVANHWQIKVITKLPNSEQSYKGKVKTHNYINRQNQSTTGKLWKP